MMIAGWIAFLFVGIVLGMIGGGGAILAIPIFVYLFNIAPLKATSYSLFVVGATSLIGVARFHRSNFVHYREGIIFVIPSLIGTFISRKQLLPFIPEFVFQFSKDRIVLIAFALVMLVASLSMIFSKERNTNKVARKKMILKFVFLGFIVGFITGFVGAGGGFLIIPALVVFAQMPRFLRERS